MMFEGKKTPGPEYSVERLSDTEPIDRAEMWRAVDRLREQDVRNRGSVVGPLRRIFELLRSDAGELLPDGDYEGFDAEREKGFRRRISDEMERLKWSITGRWQEISEGGSSASGDIGPLLADLRAMAVLSGVRMSAWTERQREALDRLESLQTGSYVEIRNAADDFRALCGTSGGSSESSSPVSETIKTEDTKPFGTDPDPTVDRERDSLRSHAGEMPPWEVIRGVEEEIRAFREISATRNGPSDKDMESFADRLSERAADLEKAWATWKAEKAYRDRIDALGDIRSGKRSLRGILLDPKATGEVTDDEWIRIGAIMKKGAEGGMRGRIVELTGAASDDPAIGRAFDTCIRIGGQIAVAQGRLKDAEEMLGRHGGFDAVYERLYPESGKKGSREHPEEV